eukprot:450365-Rhodomonas_salina.4
MIAARGERGREQQHWQGVLSHVTWHVARGTQAHAAARLRPELRVTAQREIKHKNPRSRDTGLADSGSDPLHGHVRTKHRHVTQGQGEPEGLSVSSSANTKPASCQIKSERRRVSTTRTTNAFDFAALWYH